MIELKINFSQVRSRVSAAESLQEAGQDDASKKILYELAEELVTKLSSSSQLKEA